jgi:D-alanyl-D-alanine carboxypeptidase (penicillin-binding protein 5/6)
MNATAKDIGMKDTNYANPHGLDCSYRLEAYSNVEDQALLAKTVFNHPECVAIMGTKAHTAQMKTTIGREVEVRKKEWKNTHLLLNEAGFIGGKTGQTQNAGNCLVTCF